MNPMSDVSTNHVLIKALSRLLTPIARLLLKHGVSYQAFTDVARKVFVDVAHHEFGLADKKQTAARVALLTGVNRKDVAKLIKQESTTIEHNDFTHAVSRILSGWLSDPVFQDGSGEPAMLSIEDGDTIFASLVKQYGKDITHRAALDELADKDNVVVIGNMVQLKKRAYVPEDDFKQQLRIFGNASYDLLATLDYNLDPHNPKKRMQRSVIYTNVPMEASQLIQSRSEKEGQAFLESINSWISTYDRDSNDKLVGSGKMRVGVGIYYFEEDVTDYE